MCFIEKINSLHLDVLKEIGNIGAAHSATALSGILGQKIEMSVPNVRIVSFDEMMELAGGPDNVVATVFLRIEGDITGSMFFTLSLSAATYFIHKMIEDQEFTFDSPPPYSEIAMSCIQELGNILSGSYLSALSDFTHLNVYQSIPFLTIDMVGATISFGLIELSQVSDYAIVIDTLLEIDGNSLETINGHFFLLPDPDSFDVIFNSLGVATDV